MYVFQGIYQIHNNSIHSTPVIKFIVFIAQYLNNNDYGSVKFSHLEF